MNVEITSANEFEKGMTKIQSGLIKRVIRMIEAKISSGVTNPGILMSIKLSRSLSDMISDESVKIIRMVYRQAGWIISSETLTPPRPPADNGCLEFSLKPKKKRR